MFLPSSFFTARRWPVAAGCSYSPRELEHDNRFYSVPLLGEILLATRRCSMVFLNNYSAVDHLHRESLPAALHRWLLFHHGRALAARRSVGCRFGSGIVGPSLRRIAAIGIFAINCRQPGTRAAQDSRRHPLGGEPSGNTCPRWESQIHAESTGVGVRRWVKGHSTS